MWTENRSDNIPQNPLEVINGVGDLTNEQKLPDARKHQIISFIKSGVRILGYALLPFDLGWAVGVLIFSEVIGIVEELV